MERKTVKLGDVCDLIKNREKGVLIDKSNYVSTENMLPNKGGVVPSSISPYDGAIIYHPKDVLISNIRPYFKKIWFADKIGGCSGDVLCFRSNSKIDSTYLYYLLSQDSFFDYVMAGSKGTKMPRGDKGQIMQYEFPLPPLETQRRIVAILSSLDDKIENNNRINRNLEAQAQAVFKSWFVDFEPFGGVLPEDWEETTIGEICKCYLGGTPSRAKAEYWNGEIPWINSGEVNKYRILEGSEYITELGLQKSATKLLPRKTTVLAITGATLGQVSLLEIEACANQSVIGIVQNEKVPYEFIYPLILNDIEQIMLHQTGGAQQHINKDNVESHKLILPTDEVMAKYKAIQAPLFETIANNCFESQRLAALRDTLLPKLMKGEIAL